MPQKRLSPTPPRVALIHYWLVNYRGGERVLSELAAFYPQADLFTLVADQALVAQYFPNRRLTTSFLQKIPGCRRHYPKLLPLMPLAQEQFDLSGYDLVISSESGPAKGVVVSPGATHLCYCHSPMRYLYDQRREYEDRMGWLGRTALKTFAHGLRQWDFVTAQRLDAVAVNSAFVGQRVSRYWNRESEVIAPPVETDAFRPAGDSGFYFLLSQLVPYKRVELAVEAFNELGLPLLIGGDGTERRRLERMAQSNVRFTGPLSRGEAVKLMNNCRAFIFPGVEDFGIAPVEANAAGKVVIGFGQGGLLETQTEQSSLFFHEPRAEALVAAVRQFEKNRKDYSPDAIQKQARAFDTRVFRQKMKAFIKRHSGATFAGL